MTAIIIAIICICAIALGLMNLTVGRRRLQQMRQQGHKLAWYKQMTIIVGVEYILLGVAFLLNIGITNHLLSVTLTNVLLPIYLVLLLASGILAGVVFFQIIGTTMRRRREMAAQSALASRGPRVVESTTNASISTRQPQVQVQQRRDRRQKAAAARRRRAGKA